VVATAGTTGEPKAVAHSHGGLAQVALADVAAFGLTPADRVGWTAGVGSAATQWEVWPALCAGAELVPREESADPAAWPAERSVTVFTAPARLAERLWATGAELPALRWLLVSGEATVPPEGTGYRVATGYGTAETGRATWHEVTADTTVRGCAGRPGAGVRVYVLDAAGRRCPVGVPGEIHVGGAVPAEGYWRQPDLTRERFAAADPDGAAGRVFRTGDRGRWLPDGTLQYLGRADEVRVDGYRSIMRIESWLRDDPLVAQAVVQHFPDEPVPLVAYAVARDGVADTEAVLGRLRRALPELLVPGALMWLAELPVNRRGKIDLSALPRPAGAAGAASSAPAAGMEQRIAEVWCAVLGLDSVGAHDNFFDLGGNSLLLARLHARLQAKLATTLPIRRLFEHPTVHSLAGALTSGPATDTRDETGAAQDRASQGRASRARRTRPGR
jgi:acyl-coenzyme A synthetase/AMP-(fatty) acid ligase